MVQPISDKLLDQLSDEMKEIAGELRSRARTACEDDDAKLDRELSWMLDDVAHDRGLLIRFAFMLRGHSSRHSALAKITGRTVEAA